MYAPLIMDIKIQFDPNTGKVNFNPATGKVQTINMTCPASGSFALSFSGVTDCGIEACPFPTNLNNETPTLVYSSTTAKGVFYCVTVNGWDFTLICRPGTGKMNIYASYTACENLEEFSGIAFKSVNITAKSGLVANALVIGGCDKTISGTAFDCNSEESMWQAGHSGTCTYAYTP